MSPAIQGAPWQIIGMNDSGIPMRDYFAAKCLHALMFDYEREHENFPAVARDAYKMADAMLKAREEKPARESGFPPVDEKHFNSESSSGDSISP